MGTGTDSPLRTGDLFLADFRNPVCVFLVGGLNEDFVHAFVFGQALLGQCSFFRPQNDPVRLQFFGIKTTRMRPLSPRRATFQKDQAPVGSKAEIRGKARPHVRGGA